MMTEAGFRQGSLSACVSYNEQKNVRVVVHGEDFTVCGKSRLASWSCTTKNGGEAQGPTGER